MEETIEAVKPNNHGYCLQIYRNFAFYIIIRKNVSKNKERSKSFKCENKKSLFQQSKCTLKMILPWYVLA